MATPHVGIFWFVPDEAADLALVCDRTPLSQAEPYGDCLTHAKGHYEYWSELGAMGEAALRRQGIPTAAALCEYEEFPRGRIVHHVSEGRFTIYADRKLFSAKFIKRIIAAFDLPAERCDVRADGHYRCTRTTKTHVKKQGDQCPKSR